MPSVLALGLVVRVVGGSREFGARMTIRAFGAIREKGAARGATRSTLQYFRILLALLLREEANRRRSPMESVLIMLEPIFLILVLSFVSMFLGRRTMAPLGTVSILFYATGLFALYFFIYLSRRMRSAIEPATRRFPLERRLDHIFAHIILRTFDYVLLGFVLFGALYLFYGEKVMPHDWSSIVLGLGAIVMLGFGWGVTNLILMRRFWLWGRIFNPLNRSLILISGVFFLPEFLTPSVRHIVSYNPLVHAIALFRSGFYPDYPKLLLDINYLFFCAICAVAVGLILERVTRRSED